MKSPKINVFITITLLLIFFAQSVFAAQDEALKFGIHPFKSPSKLNSMFKPILAEMSEKLGRKIIFMSGKSYEDVLKRYASNDIDFGYLGPSGFIKAYDVLGVIPLARIKPNGKGTFQGVIVVRKNSPIQTLSDLKGKRFAFGDENSTLSHFVPHYMLIQAGISINNLESHAYTGKHDNVALSVLNGKFDAGGLKPAVAKNYLNKGLRILTRSEDISEHVFVANKNLDQATLNAIKNALFSASVTSLQAIKSNITGVEEVKVSDYDNLRKIMKVVSEDDPL